LRQGKPAAGHPACGVVARGVITRGSYKSTENRDGTGGDRQRVDVEFDLVLGPADEPIPDPYRDRSSTYSGPMGSGGEIKDDAIVASIEAQFTIRLAQVVPTTSHNPTELERVKVNILDRRSQPAFRAALLQAYGGQCAISRCDVEDVLEAAHILPFSQGGLDTVSNGLLLRADLHTIFDLNLLRIDPETRTVRVTGKLAACGHYGWLDGVRLNDPAALEARVDVSALRWRYAQCAITLTP
jgi:hypothetical protein